MKLEAPKRTVRGHLWVGAAQLALCGAGTLIFLLDATTRYRATRLFLALVTGTLAVIEFVSATRVAGSARGRSN